MATLPPRRTSSLPRPADRQPFQPRPVTPTPTPAPNRPPRTSLRTLQALHPISLLLLVGTILTLQSAVHPSLSRISATSHTLLSPSAGTLAPLSFVLFALQAAYVLLLCTAALPEALAPEEPRANDTQQGRHLFNPFRYFPRPTQTAKIIHDATGLKFVVVNLLTMGYVISFYARAWMVSMTFLVLTIVLLLWIYISMALTADFALLTHPFRALAIHAPPSLMLSLTLHTLLPHLVFVRYHWLANLPDRIDTYAPEALRALLLSHLPALALSLFRPDPVYAFGAVAGLWSVYNNDREALPPKPLKLKYTLLVLLLCHAAALVLGLLYRFTHTNAVGQVVLAPPPSHEGESSESVYNHQPLPGEVAGRTNPKAQPDLRAVSDADLDRRVEQVSGEIVPGQLPSLIRAPGTLEPGSIV